MSGGGCPARPTASAYASRETAERRTMTCISQSASMSMSASASSATADPESSPSVWPRTRFSMKVSDSNLERSIWSVRQEKPSTPARQRPAASALSVASRIRFAPYADRRQAAGSARVAAADVHPDEVLRAETGAAIREADGHAAGAHLRNGPGGATVGERGCLVTPLKALSPKPAIPCLCLGCGSIRPCRARAL
eukprot:scaffold15920_cov129-Isochrysis_galbana.AAC.4